MIVSQLLSAVFVGGSWCGRKPPFPSSPGPARELRQLLPGFGLSPSQDVWKVRYWHAIYEGCVETTRTRGSYSSEGIELVG